MPKNILALIKNNLLLCGFIILGPIAYFSQNTPEEKDVPTSFTVPDVKSADTFIPRGFVLVPIEMANAESLSSLVGDVGGVVDLYLATTDRQKGGQKVGSRLKLLRAPLNPQQYAVLVKDSESQRILQHSGPFVAVVQNPETRGAEVTSNGPSRVKIDYQN